MNGKWILVSLTLLLAAALLPWTAGDCNAMAPAARISSRSAPMRSPVLSPFFIQFAVRPQLFNLQNYK